uniref:ATPase AAA-type core domain-containing protein n=1 Tax=Lygus hesperus TaxID=30085 RepID=A0A0A9WM33_LYGHE
MTLFARIRQLACVSQKLICVLIDEVESIAATRELAMQSNEPSDAIRVVNALLTQLDLLQRIPNVFVLTTSNLTNAIDHAFLSRADLKLSVGLPGYEARKAMLHQGIM